MKRNTKSSPNFDNVFIDILVVVFSLFIIAFTLFLFLQNLNKTFVRNDKTSVAIVTYKYKSVQRKFIDRAVWDRPIQFSPVYNGDIIRTAPDSEAAIYFSDKNVVNIGSNTMIQIFVKDAESSVEVNEGKVSVKTSGSKMLVKSEGASVTVEKDSILHADRVGADKFRLAVEKGEASVVKNTVSNGKTETQTEESAEILTAGNAVTEDNGSSVVMISPASGAKLFNRNPAGQTIPVVFKWQSSFPETEDLVLEISGYKNFGRNVKRFEVKGLNELTVEQESGTVYWRLYAASLGAEDASAVSGKLNIISVPAPVLLEPEIDSKYSYKNTLPCIRFLWKGNKSAVSYLLEIADNPEMLNPKISRTVSTESVSLSELEEGSWYWRIVPDYLGFESNPTDSEVSFFHIRKLEDKAPDVMSSFQTSLETVQGKTVNFSWKSVSEAKKYVVRICDNEQMKNPVIEKTITSNYFEVKNADKLLAGKDFYWTVESIGSDNTVLALSNKQKIKVENRNAVLRTVFPPEGYTLADTLCRDTRFTWKTNLENECYFQVSSSKDFKNIVINEKTSGTGINGIVLKQGEWYWRVAVKDDDAEITCEPKKIIIAPPLPKPELIGLGKTMIILPEGKNKFKWSSVPGADYYQVKITKPGLDIKPLYENLYITNTEIEIALQSIEDGIYIVSVQGFAGSTLISSRRYGLAADQTVAFKHLKPVEFISPANGERLSGVDALLNPGVLKWASMEPPVTSKLTLKKAGSSNLILSVDNPDFTVKLPPLQAGTYYWHVSAVLDGEFDISAPKNAVFTVLPVPPLPQVNFISPQQGKVLDVSFFKSNTHIKFAWQTIKEATHYAVHVYGPKKKTILKKEFKAEAGKKEMSFDFKNLSALSRGIFFIEVRAVKRLETGLVFQDGKVSTLKFVIDLPQSKKVETDETGVMYGQ